MNNLLKKWRPVPNVTGELHLKSLSHDVEGLKIIMTGDSLLGNVLRIVFYLPLFYQNIGESFNLLNDYEYDYNYNEEEDNGLPYPLYTVENSTLQQYFHEKDQLVHYKHNEVEHYRIYTVDDYIDVLSSKSDPPNVDWIGGWYDPRFLL